MHAMQPPVTGNNHPPKPDGRFDLDFGALAKSVDRFTNEIRDAVKTLPANIATQTQACDAAYLQGATTWGSAGLTGGFIAGCLLIVGVWNLLKR